MPETAFNYSSLAPANNPRPKNGRRARAAEQPPRRLFSAGEAAHRHAPPCLPSALAPSSPSPLVGPLVGEGGFAKRRWVRGFLRGCRPLIRPRCFASPAPFPPRGDGEKGGFPPL